MSGDRRESDAEPGQTRSGGQTSPGRSPQVFRLRILQNGSLLGLDGRRTSVAVCGLVGLCLLHLVSALAGMEIAGVRIQTLSPMFDVLSTVLILTSLFVVTVGPLAYAAWNGGPALAFAIALVPALVGELLAQRWVLDLDVAVALTAGAAGAAFALFVTVVRSAGSLHLERLRTLPRRNALVVTTLVAGAVGVVTRFALNAPGRMLAAYRPFALLWTIPLGVGLLFVRARRR